MACCNKFLEDMKMAVIEMARELGKLIQEDERYLRLDRASKANDNDKELQL